MEVGGRKCRSEGNKEWESGYIMQKNGGREKHIAERLRRATIAMK